jgi:uncharacterized protein YraI
MPALLPTAVICRNPIKGEITMKKLLAGAAFALTLGLSPLASAPAMAAASGWTPATLTIHAGPGNNYPVVAHVKARSRIDVQGCLEGASWCNIFAHGKYGWVRGNSILVTSHHKHISVMKAAASDRPPIVVYDTNKYWDAYYRNEPFYKMRAKYGYNAYPVPVAATGRPPYDRTGGNAAGGSVHNHIPRMIDDRIYAK